MTIRSGDAPMIASLFHVPAVPRFGMFAASGIVRNTASPLTPSRPKKPPTIFSGGTPRSSTVAMALTWAMTIRCGSDGISTLPVSSCTVTRPLGAEPFSSLLHAASNVAAATPSPAPRKPLRVSASTMRLHCSSVSSAVLSSAGTRQIEFGTVRSIRSSGRESPRLWLSNRRN